MEAPVFDDVPAHHAGDAWITRNQVIMKNVLLILDDRLYEASLIQQAAVIAAQCGADLIICKVTPSPAARSLAASMNSYGLHEKDSDNNAWAVQAGQHYGCLCFDGLFKPGIRIMEIQFPDHLTLKNLVMEHAVWLVIIEKPPLEILRNTMVACQAMQLLNQLNAPVLLLSGQSSLKIYSKIAYLTDLRYANNSIIRFLKAFRPAMYLTHITAAGLVDLEGHYANQLHQEIILGTGFANSGLLNLKSRHLFPILEYELDARRIQMLVFFNRQHDLLHRIMGPYQAPACAFHQLPMLVFPYYNWYMHPCFYRE